MDNKICKFYNTLILGEINSGKCTLKKSLNSAFGTLSNLNIFTLNNSTYYLLRVPCFVDFNENFDNGMVLADIIIVMFHFELKNLDFTINQIMYSLALGHKNFMFLVNKIDLMNYDIMKYFEIKSKILDLIFSKGLKIFDDNKQILNSNWSFISAIEGYNIKINDIKQQNEVNVEVLLKSLLMKFEIDNDDGILNFSGKIYSGQLNLNRNYFVLPSKISINCISIKNSEDELLDCANQNMFISVKAKIIDNLDKIENICRGNLISSSMDMPIFNIFEAEIETFDLCQKIISKGFECIINLHSIREEIIVEKIMDTTSFIKSHSKAKLLIKSKNIICAEKFDTFQRLSYFSMLGQDLKIIGFGKILRYKKI